MKLYIVNATMKKVKESKPFSIFHQYHYFSCKFNNLFAKNKFSIDGHHQSKELESKARTASLEKTNPFFNYFSLQKNPKLDFEPLTQIHFFMGINHQSN